MKKSTGFIKDTFENLQETAVDLTMGTLKKGFKELTTLGSLTSESQSGRELSKNNNFTALDQAKLEEKYREQNSQKNLEEKYKNQDSLQIEGLRKRYFQNVINDSERAALNYQKSEENRIKQLDHQSASQRHEVKSAPMPQGKQARGLFGGKRKSSVAIPNSENKISKGK